MKNKTFDVKYSDLNLGTANIEQVMGFEPGFTDPTFLSIINEVNENISEHCGIRAEMKVFDNVRIDHHKFLVVIENTEFLVGDIVANQLRGTEKIAMIICTAGKSLTDWMSEENKSENSLKAYTIDLFGSQIVDTAMDIIQKDLENDCRAQGLKITNRYSPGYCGWKTDEQFKYFSLYPDNYPGIRLTDSALMQPVKSISCVIGIGKDVKFNNYTCGFCDRKDCVYRELKKQKA